MTKRVNVRPGEVGYARVDLHADSLQAALESVVKGPDPEQFFRMMLDDRERIARAHFAELRIQASVDRASQIELAYHDASPERIAKRGDLTPGQLGGITKDAATYAAACILLAVDRARRAQPGYGMVVAAVEMEAHFWMLHYYRVDLARHPSPPGRAAGKEARIVKLVELVRTGVANTPAELHDQHDFESLNAKTKKADCEEIARRLRETA